MRLKTAILAAALLVAVPTHALFAQSGTKTKTGKQAAAVTDYNAVYKAAVADYDANRNLEALTKFNIVLRKYPDHVRSQRYVALLRQRLRAAAAVPLAKRRLHALVLKNASFEEATLSEVMEYVTLQAEKLSNGKVKPGLVIRGGEAVRDRTLTFKVGAVPLDKLIDTVASLTNTTVKYTDYALTFTSLPTAEEIAAKAAKKLDQAEAKQRARAALEAAKNDPFR